MTSTQDGAALPAQTEQRCLAKGQSDEVYVPKHTGCKIVDSERTGSKTEFKLLCPGTTPMIGAGEITKSTKNYQGTLRMNGIRAAQNTELTQSFSGRLVGDCADPS